MKYLILDTETNGLPHNYKLGYEYTNNWPEIVQIAWIVTDGNEVYEKYCELQKPIGFVWDEEAEKVHGKDEKLCLDIGKYRKDLIIDFIKAIESHQVTIVGHNIGFDIKVLCAAMVRELVIDGARVLFDHRSICTMKNTTNYCRIPGKFGYKWPKLEELHGHLFGSRPNELHDAMADVEVTAKCFFELQKRGILPA